jgi:hypothetical protein
MTLYVLVYDKTLLHIITILLYSMNWGGGDHRCGDAVGWDTAPQVRKSRIRFLMASLQYFTDLILQATIWPWGRINLYRMSTRNISWVGTGSWCKRLTILPPSCADCLEIWEPPGTIRACPGLYRGCFTFTGWLKSPCAPVQEGWCTALEVAESHT